MLRRICSHPQWTVQDRVSESPSIWRMICDGCGRQGIGGPADVTNPSLVGNPVAEEDLGGGPRRKRVVAPRVKILTAQS